MLTNSQYICLLFARDIDGIGNDINATWTFPQLVQRYRNGNNQTPEHKIRQALDELVEGGYLDQPLHSLTQLGHDYSQGA